MTVAVLLSKNYIALEVLTEIFQERFDLFSNQLGFIHNHIFRAVAKYYLYGMEKGVAELEQALLKAQEDDILLPFVENAPHIVDMLRISANRNSRNEFIKKLIFYCEQYLEGLKSTCPSKISLSERELEVLSLSADGLNREEIAGLLRVSQGTVKTHLHNIYLKLEASGKVSAIKIAQMNGLIKN